MKIAVKNTKNMNHTICTTDGQRIIIGPRNFTIINTDSEKEIRYWTNIKQSNACVRYGLDVVLDEKEVMKLVVSDLSSNSKSINDSLTDKVYTDVSVVDGFVSPVAKELAKTTYTKENTKQLPPDSKYSEESLMKLSKEDLFGICDNFNIKYKRNNSVKTLVKLLIENGVVEE